MVKRVAVLGCTGTVGQRFIQLLEGHPWFQVAVIAASERSAGHKYKDIVRWKLATTPPPRVMELEVQLCKNGPAYEGVDIVFSALDSSVAGPIEDAFAQAGVPVFSNARNHRMDADVPILIPHANPEHLDIVRHQRIARSYPKAGFIVTNANCSSTGLTVALAPIQAAFGIEKMFVTTLQAISGAGYPGVASLDIMDNVVPYISGEEDKVETEPMKILGTLNADRSGFVPADIKASAHCTRVAVLDGHTECVSLQLKNKATVEEVKEALRNWTTEAQSLKLPSAPPKPILVQEAPDRPQPRLDRDADGGYTVTVGRVRECTLFDIKFTLVSHNTVIGAAGGSILNAELAHAKGLL